MTPTPEDIERRARGNMEGRMFEIGLYRDNPELRNKGGLVLMDEDLKNILSIRDIRKHTVEGDELELSNFWSWILSFDGYVPGKGESGPAYWQLLWMWGGPSDELRIYYTPKIGRNKNIKDPWRVEYVYKDWGTGHTIDVTDRKEIRWLLDYLDQHDLFLTYTDASRYFERARKKANGW